MLDVGIVFFRGSFASAGFDAVFDRRLVDIFATGAAFSTALGFSNFLVVVERGGGEFVASDSRIQFCMVVTLYRTDCPIRTHGRTPDRVSL